LTISEVLERNPQYPRILSARWNDRSGQARMPGSGWYRVLPDVAACCLWPADPSQRKSASWPGGDLTVRAMSSHLAIRHTTVISRYCAYRQCEMTVIRRVNTFVLARMGNSQGVAPNHA
jgi:hypothetical protein